MDLEAPVDPVELGGQRYSVSNASVEARLDVSHTTTGYALRLRFPARLEGPCMRCLGQAGRGLDIDSREVDQPGGDLELRSPYVDGDELDLRAWARDSLVLSLPTQVICREDCLGLCAECGENLNEAGTGHGHESAPDPRWAKLRELRLE